MHSFPHLSATVLRSALVGLVGLIGVPFTPPAIAQIIPDATLPVNSTVAPGCTDCTIDGGTVRGTNLFHSFREFSIPTGGAARFNNAIDIQNILTRVTGNSISTIDGLIQTNGTANLFFLNPNGILFGPNAQLNVGGSFLATTASSFQFPDSSEFSATNPQGPPLLTINITPGLQYGTNPGSIQVQESVLQVPRTKTLALVGGNVNVDGAALVAFEGRVELGSLAGTGRVELGGSVDAPGLRFSGNEPRADITFSNSQVFVDAGGGGDVALTARTIRILDRSFIGAGIFSGFGSVNSQAGDITLNASQAVDIQGDSLILNQVAARAVGTGGNINITTGSLSLTEGSQIGAVTSGQGSVGNVRIQATGAVTVDGQVDVGFGSTIASVVAPGAIGNGGSVAIAAGSLSLVRGAAITTGTFGIGRAGNVDIQVQDAVVLDGVAANLGGSAIVSQVAPGAVGDGGNVRITTGSLAVTNGATLSVSTNGRGNAGNLTIQATGAVRFDGEGVLDGGTISISRASSQVQERGIGNAGSIEITAASLRLSNGAQVSTSTFGRGDAGNVSLSAETISLDGLSRTTFSSGVLSTVEPGAIGKGGNIAINTGALSVTNGALINVATSGRGDAGNIDVQARDAVVFDGTNRDGRFTSGASSRVNPGGVGKGGNITLATGSLTVRNGARLTTSTRGQGDAGTIRITARDTVTVIGSGNPATSSGLFSSVTQGAIGKGGNIVIDANRLTIQDGAQVTVDSQGSGEGGNIEIQARSLTLNNQSTILAETASTTGGNINLNVQDLLLLRRSSSISTTAGTAQGAGDGGNIAINAGFIVAIPRENSDITANAFTGRGGNIAIATQGIFGIAFRPRLTPFSDITASSEFGLAGTVNITTLGIDPVQRGVNLPAIFSTPPLAQGCRASGSQRGSFVNTGRGGVPSSPVDPLAADTIWQDLEPLDRGQGSGNREQGTGDTGTRHSHTPYPTPHTPIVEAQGWVILPDGAIALVADPSAVLPHQIGNLDLDCSL